MCKKMYQVLGELHSRRTGRTTVHITDVYFLGVKNCEQKSSCLDEHNISPSFLRIWCLNIEFELMALLFSKFFLFTAFVCCWFLCNKYFFSCPKLQAL